MRSTSRERVGEIRKDFMEEVENEKQLCRAGGQSALVEQAT